MSPLDDLFRQLAVAWAAVANTWWLWVPPLLFMAGRQLWKIYLRIRYFRSLEWVLLEVRIPRTIAKTPEAMEQVFAGLQTMYWEFDPWETWWLGLQHDYIIFELMSTGGETKFYIRAPVFFRNMVEAQIYAQYPESEVVEVEDYVNKLPDRVPNEEWDMFGIEFKFDKEDAYPIKTYREFVSLTANQEEFAKVDPFSSMVELFGKLKPGEHMGYHLLMRPTQTGGPDKWKKDGEALVAKLIGKKIPAPKGKVASALEPLAPLTQGWGEALRPGLGLGPTAPAVGAPREEPLGTSMMLHLSPGMREVVAAIERDILKPGFETIVRFCYIARRDVFSLSHMSSFIGALKTYNTQTLNAFKLNSASMATRVPWWLPSFLTRRKKQHKKSLYYQYYRSRKPFTDTWSLRSKFVVLNIEELATIYHYPGMVARAPMLPRIEARRAEPPATLPVG
ncbi:MAG: hypothetical protein AAB650_00570 [Patescibacteria group bacterium]|mgnify:CR=1 FL=1